MDKYFICDKIVCARHADDVEEKEDDYMMIAFSDNGDEPDEYLILQKAYFFDEQDRDLGTDGYYLEFVSPECEIIGYDMCNDIIINASEVIFRFKKNKDNVESLVIDISKIKNELIPGDFKEVFNEIIYK